MHKITRDTAKNHHLDGPGRKRGQLPPIERTEGLGDDFRKNQNQKRQYGRGYRDILTAEYTIDWAPTPAAPTVCAIVLRLSMAARGRSMSFFSLRISRPVMGAFFRKPQ
jgi:hypothetical protein